MKMIHDHKLCEKQEKLIKRAWVTLTGNNNNEGMSTFEEVKLFILTIHGVDTLQNQDQSSQRFTINSKCQMLALKIKFNEFCINKLNSKSLTVCKPSKMEETSKTESEKFEDIEVVTPIKQNLLNIDQQGTNYEEFHINIAPVSPSSVLFKKSKIDNFDDIFEDDKIKEQY